jgi:hypothetical protein
MIIRSNDGELTVVSQEDYNTDDAYYMKCASVKGVTLESPDHGSEQLSKIVVDITSNARPRPVQRKKQHSGKYRPRMNSIEK